MPGLERYFERIASMQSFSERITENIRSDSAIQSDTSQMLLPDTGQMIRPEIPRSTPAGINKPVAVRISGEFRQRGRDLVASIEEEQYRTGGAL